MNPSDPNDFKVTVETIPLSVMDLPRPIVVYRGHRVNIPEIHINSLIKFSNRPKGTPIDKSRRAVEWGGYWDHTDGYGASNIAFAEEVIGCGWNIKPVWLENREGIKHCNSDKILRFKDADVKAEIGVSFVIPPDIHMMSSHLKRLILYTLWESTRMHPEWIPILHQADMIVTGSEFCRLVLRASGAPAPIIVLPIPIGDEYQPIPRKPPTDICQFLFVSAPYQRKGLDVLIGVWKQHFANRKDVRLRLHTKRPNVTRESKAVWYEDQIKGIPNIEYSYDQLTPEALMKLYAESHVLVHPSRGEGFGRTVAEALATEMPVVATGATGLTDFFNNENGFPIDVKGWTPCNHPFYQYGNWAEPDADSLRERMEEVMSDYSAAQDKARHGSRTVRAKYNRRVAGQAWNFLLENADRLGTHKDRMALTRDYQIFLSRACALPIIDAGKDARVDDFFEDI